MSTMSPWLNRAYRTLVRSQHLIIYGAVDDLVMYPGVGEAAAEFVSFADGLHGLLRTRGFSTVLWYDLADGLWSRSGVPDPRLATVVLDGAPRRDPLIPLPPPLTPGPGGLADELRLAASDRRSGDTRPVNDVMPMIRAAMTQQQSPTVVVIDHADLLFGRIVEQPAGADVAHVLTALRLAASEAVSVSTPAENVRNAIVLVSKELSDLPKTLTLRDLQFTAVNIESPEKGDRAAFLMSRRASFWGDPSAAELEKLAELCDGMSFRDLESLAVTSAKSRIAAAEGRRLVTHQRFGIRRNPWEHLDRDRVRRAISILGDRVFGQLKAVTAVAGMLANAHVGIDFAADAYSGSERPRGVLFFVGPTGVGKTELAKALAELVFGDERAMCRFDMSEFQEEHAGERLTGAPPGYVGHEQGGVLTNWVLAHPFSLLLFDEMEKANPAIFDKFLQIIDDGRLTDGRGQTAYFSHSVIIFTSNIGAATMPPSADYEALEDHFQAAIEQKFRVDLGRPELLGRLGGGIVVFDALRPDFVPSISSKFVRQLVGSARHAGYELDIDATALDQRVLELIGHDTTLGARSIRDPILESLLRIPLNRWILKDDVPAGSTIRVTLPLGARQCQFELVSAPSFGPDTRV